MPTPKPQGDACDDGDTETKDDQCDGAGSCSGTPYTCATDQCDAAAIPNGVDCDLIYKPEGIACDDGLIETKGDQCDGQGGCAGTLYSCTATQCEASAVPNGQGCDVDYWAVGYECDDGDPTTKGDQCDGQGTCAGSPYTCELGQCDSASVPDGTGCVVTHKLEGIACDDGEPGTKGDQCDGAGGCSGSPYVCTPEQCEATSIPNGQGCDVDFWAQGTGCDDGDVTTQGDVCDGQGGCAGTPYTCTPGLCEVGAVPNGQGCDPVYAASGAACDDGLIDTLGDQCDGQGGCSGTPYACIPGPCEVTSTPDGVGCVPSYAAEGVGCDDGNAGTKDDSCDGQGGCTGIPYGCVAGPCELSSVPDGDGCTVTYEAQGVGCDDGAEDTMGDQCDGQGGCAGTPYMCQPTQCELTSVPDGSGCVPTNAPAGVLCDDDDLNTKLDVCDGFGQCAGEPYTCTASQCQVSSTADGLGCEVVLKPAGTPCDDGLPATTGDACNPLGQCVGTPTVCGDEVIEGTEVCDDGNNVTEVACPYGTPSCTACRAGCNEVLQLTGPYCGDDILQSDQGEACDDGNQIDGDGCSSTCQGEVSGCVILGVDARTLDQQPSNWQQSSCQTLCEDGGGVIPDGFRIATSEEAQFLSSVLSFGSCAACGLGSCWWYGAGNQLNASGVTSYSCTTGGCTAAAPFCYTQVLLVREGKDGTCVQ